MSAISHPGSMHMNAGLGVGLGVCLGLRGQKSLPHPWSQMSLVLVVVEDTEDVEEAEVEEKEVVTVLEDVDEVI